MARHVNIPIFIPHLGCPNQCVFCNQRSISGVLSFDPSSVKDIIEESLSTVKSDDFVEVAFFGGSFTGIDRDLMISLLETVYSYKKQGRINTIRCSTRPDYINEEVISLLNAYGMQTVELGLQSVSDEVLKKAKRGHGSSSEITACKMIIDSGLRLGGQMMIGLPKSSIEDEIATAEFIVSSGASEARIYPTVVFKDTELYDMTVCGDYLPLTLDDAVERAAKVLKIFIDGGVKVLRIGLCDSENLHSDKTYFAGPNHPALGELVLSRHYYDSISSRLAKMSVPKGAELTVYVAAGCVSKAIGQKRENKIRLAEQFNLSDIKVKESALLSLYDIHLEIQERKQNVFKVT